MTLLCSEANDPDTLYSVLCYQAGLSIRLYMEAFLPPRLSLEIVINKSPLLSNSHRDSYGALSIMCGPPCLLLLPHTLLTPPLLFPPVLCFFAVYEERNFKNLSFSFLSLQFPFSCFLSFLSLPILCFPYLFSFPFLFSSSFPFIAFTFCSIPFLSFPCFPFLSFLSPLFSYLFSIR